MRGEVKKRGDTYSVRYDAGVDPVTGKRIQKRKSGFATKREAEAALAQIITEAERGTHPYSDKTTVGEWLTEWLENQCPGRLSPTTMQGYRMIVRLHLLPALGHIRLAKLTPAAIQKYYREEQASGRKDGKASEGEGLSARTVAQHHRVLHRALGQAMKSSLIPRNPCDLVDPPRAERPQQLTVSEDDVPAVLDHLRGTYLYIPALLALATGARRAEILGLRWGDVDLDTGTITIRQSLLRVGRESVVKGPKTADSVRSVKLPASVTRDLKAHQLKQKEWRLAAGTAWNGSGLVCVREDGSAINPDTLSSTFRCEMKRAGFPGVSFHGLRHSHATMLLKWNVHPKKVAERLGHSSTKLTMDTYSHVTPTMQDEVASVIDERLFGNGKKAK